MILVKSAPKKCYAQKTDFFRTEANFQSYLTYSQKKKFSSLRRDNEPFWELKKRSKM
jgi:hypothetical protein